MKFINIKKTPFCQSWIQEKLHVFLKKLSNLRKDRLKLILLTILIIGACIRLLGIYPGYSPYHPDEGKDGYSSAWYMFSKKTFDLPHYHYPALIPEIQFLSFILILFPILWAKFIFFNFSLFINNLNDISKFFPDLIIGKNDLILMYWGRLVTAVFSILTLVLVYLTSKLLFPRLTALFCLLIFALNLRAVFSAHFDLPDAYNAFFLILAFYSSLRLLKNPSYKWYILNGISIALFFSVKMQVFALSPFILVHLYLVCIYKGKLKEKITYLLSFKLFLAIIITLLTVLILNIGPLTHLREFLEGLSYQAGRYGFRSFRLSPISLSYFYNIVLTPFVSVLILGGLFWGLKKYFFSTILVLSVIIPYLYYFFYFTSGWFYPRNFVGIVPFFALLAGLGLESIWNITTRYLNRYSATFIFVLIVSFILFESTKNSLIHNINYMKPWNITTMRQCLSKNVLEGKTVAAHPTDKYILFSLPSIDTNKNLKFIPLDIGSNYTSSELQEEGADYALVGLDVVGDQNSVWWMARPNFWNKPRMVAENIFVSLAARELFQNTLCAAVKPWQAVENNYVFVQVPTQVKSEWNKISSFEFDSEETLFDWHKIDGSRGEGNNLIWDGMEGGNKNGSLKIKTVTPVLPVARWISPVFKINPGNFYKATALIRSSTNVDIKQRDGFLRLDFYQYKPAFWNEETLGLSHNLSSRYFGEKEWKSREVAGLAPKEAEFATVSFQTSAPSIADFWFDDLVVYEGKDEDIPPETGFSNFKFIPDPDVFVPNLGSGY